LADEATREDSTMRGAVLDLREAIENEETLGGFWSQEVVCVGNLDIHLMLCTSSRIKKIK
jgi:hypothetical protein